MQNLVVIAEPNVAGKSTPAPSMLRDTLHIPLYANESRFRSRIMGTDEKIINNSPDLFVRYSDEINRAYERAVREALLKHKKLENSVAVEQDGKLVILQPDEIEVD